MDFRLNDEQLAFAEAAREFALGELAPNAAHWDAESIFPRETFQRAGALGFCAMYAPESIGGLGLPRLDATLVFEEMAAWDPSTTAFLTFTIWPLGWSAPGAQKAFANTGGRCCPRVKSWLLIA